METLVEGLPKIPEALVAIIIKHCVNKLSAIGPDFELTEDDFEFGGLFAATGLQGQTALGNNGRQFKQRITFNSNMFREGLEDIYFNTIYHELIHVLVNKYMIVHKIIEIDSKKDLQINDQEFFDAVEEDNGHGGKWLELATRANKVLDLAMPLTPYCSDESVSAVYDASVDEIEEPPLEIQCQDCGMSRKFLTIHPEELPPIPILLALYQDTKEKNTNNFCKKCNGTLYIIIRDKRLRDFAEHALNEMQSLLMLARLTV